VKPGLIAVKPQDILLEASFSDILALLAQAIAVSTTMIG
jgi:hypothetical protein